MKKLPPKYNRTFSFGEVAKIYVFERKKDVSAATRSCYATSLRFAQRVAPEVFAKETDEVTPDDLIKIIDAAGTQVQRAKMFRFVRALCNFCERKYLFSNFNPIRLVDAPMPPKEREICVLSPEETRLLVETADGLFGARMAACFALMAYAGTRPTETTRMRFSEINLGERMIYLRKENAKTGMSRAIEIRPALMAWLSRLCLQQDDIIAPPDYVRKRRKVFKAFCAKTGKQWVQDCLRHGFATYHLRRYNSLDAARLEMGHTSAKHLLSRYLNFRGITKAMAEDYFAE